MGSRLNQSLEVKMTKAFWLYHEKTRLITKAIKLRKAEGGNKTEHKTDWPKKESHALLLAGPEQGAPLSHLPHV